MTELLLTRFQFTEESTIGRLSINNNLIGYSLEDMDRGLYNGMTVKQIRAIKKDGITAIPYGTYPLIWYQSPKRGWVPMLQYVKGFSYIEMHIGNKATDSLGCILVGKSYSDNFIAHSADEFKILRKELINNNIKQITITK